MDSSGGSGDFGLGVGSIVWVRRRNGSWWPGKILGPDELSAAHLTSPRAGTPVKLLGREDASVDWYNLEKSKRVKAFRCGEFDDCIERAESSQGMPMKKREKYARREDAILHALELEKELLKKQGIEMDSNFLGSNSAKKGSFTSSEVLENGNDQLGNLETPGFSKRLGIPSKDEFMGGSSHFQEANDRGELRQEEVLPEGVPRMRGLQDFGLKISPSKRRHSSSWKHKIIHNANGLPGGDLNIGNTRHSNDPEEAGMFFRAKRSKCVYLPPGSSNSLDDGGTPQVTAEISPAVVQGGHREPNLMVEHSSRFSESTGTGSTESDLSGSESDSSETEEDEETTSLSEQGAFGAHESRTEQDSMSSGEPDDLAFSGDTSHIFSREPVSGNEAVSKWQLKGKRNIRNLGKRHPDPTDGVSSDGRRISSRRRAPIWRSGEYRNYDFSFDDDEDGDYDDEKDLESDVFGLDHEYSLTPRGAVRDRSFRGCGIAGSEDVTWEGEHYNTGSAGQRHFGVRRGMLVEVDLKVQASYQKKVVPIISMTSKLNGHSIIGHSIQIEAIEDGSSERLLTINYDGHDGVTDYSGSSAVPSAWRTARRTANFRVPRPHRSSALDGDEEGGESRLLGREGRSQKSVGAGNFNRKGLLVRKTLPQIPTPQPDRKFAGKSSKRAGLSSSQKIRTLSSLALEQNLGNKSMHDTFDSSPIDGIIKPNSSGPTTVACIPVKLVYSRLLEKINRPPSKAVINAVRLNCEMDKSRL